MSKYLGLFLSLTSCLLVGCVQVEQTFVMHADGSGILDFTYAMAEHHVMEMEQVAQMAANMDPDGEGEVDTGVFNFDEEKIREAFESHAVEGVALEKLATEQRDGFRHVHMQIAFASLAALGKTEFMSEQDVMLIRDEQGNYLFQQSAPSESLDAQQLMGVQDGHMDPFLAQMMEGFRIKTSIKTPSRILETNADERTDDRATWVFDFEKDPTAIQKVRDARMRVVFEGSKLNISEFRSSAN